VARVKIVKPDKANDPVIREIFDWVTQIEGSVPNHFYVEMNFPEFFKAKLGATKVLWQMVEMRSSTSESRCPKPTAAHIARLLSALF
jgi:hypothetical protein